MPTPVRGERIQFADRVLAEAVRAAERDGVEPIADADAEREAAAITGTFEERLVHRARRLAIAVDLREALRQLRRATGAMLLAGVLVAALAGAAAVRASLGSADDEPANIFIILVSVLGVQTLVLGSWALLLLAHPSSLAGGSLGGLLVALGGRLSAWLHRGPAQLAALRALGGVLGTSGVGRWSLSAASHLVWIGFNTGALVVLVLLLSTRQYTFAWQTTILSERTYVPLTRALAAGPRALGFVVPTEAQIRQSRWTGGEDLRPQAAQLDATAEAWSGLILGSVVTYGLLPRVALLALCGLLAGRARHGYRLDVDRPGFRRLRESLEPGRRRLGRVDEDDDAPVASETEAPTEARERPAGPPAVVGFEIERPATDWPPPAGELRWADLGFIDDRPARDRVVSALRDGATEPAALVVVCGLTTTPDRGVERFLRDVQSAVKRPIHVVLTEGDRLRHRASAEQVAVRVEDWSAAAARAGVGEGQLIEIDLDHATDASLQKLTAVLGDPGHGPPPVAPAPGPASRLVESFTLIAERTATWPARPEPREQAELHTAIARLYRDRPSQWRSLLKAPDNLDDFAARVKTGARSAVDLLPPSLRVSPKWLAAGALSGALGCVAAAMLVTPAAIGALPIWTGLGAVVLQVVRSAMPPGDVEDTAERPDLTDRGIAVRSAALFALLLDLQGRDEAAISRLLEAALPAAGGPLDGPGPDPADPCPWLDEVRHRLDLALAQEAAS